MKPKPSPDLSTWFTKQQAAEQIGVSTKTLEGFAALGKLQSAKRPQIGKPPATEYHPQDVERLAKERNAGPGPYLVPLTPVSASEEFAKLGRTSPTGSESLVLALNGLREFIAPAPPRLFLTFKQAAEYTGLPQTYLRELVAAGKLDAIKTGRGWRIRKRDLEGL